MFPKLINKVASQANNDMTLVGLRVTITLWALMIIVVAWIIDNKWVLATILAYEVLP